MISKIKHQTYQISDFHTKCYMEGGGGGGGLDLQYGLRQAEHFMQLKIGRNYNVLSSFTKNNNY